MPSAAFLFQLLMTNIIITEELLMNCQIDILNLVYKLASENIAHEFSVDFNEFIEEEKKD